MIQPSEQPQETGLTFVRVFIVCGDCGHDVPLGVFEFDDYVHLPDLEQRPRCAACGSSNVALRPWFV